MKLRTLLSEPRLTLSFEVFPPKTDTSAEQVTAAAEAIGALHPAFVSVTYGAGGSTRANTVPLACALREHCGVEVLPHLTCIAATRDTVLEQLRAMRAAGIENVMALRGDRPAEGEFVSDFSCAADLVRLIRSTGDDFCIGGACYPEVHPESPNQREDIRYLREKVEAGCDFLTTQMCFDNHLLYNFLYKIREAGITVPVLPGIMPITDARQVKRARQLSNATLPQRFLSLVDRFGSDPLAMQQAGIAYATDQIIDLYANGIRNVHVYTMNKPAVAAAILRNLSGIVGLPA